MVAYGYDKWGFSHITMLVGTAIGDKMNII
jgi:hypothetical protein